MLTAAEDQRVGRWLGKGFWALADQGFLATGNFALNVLLARWLSPQEYGAFTVAFAIFLLLGALHIALFSEPMLIFGLGSYSDRLSVYTSAVLNTHLRFTALSSLSLLLLGVACGLFGFRDLASAFLVLALASPFILFLSLVRGICYLHSEKLSLAGLGSGLYMALMLSGTYVLYQFNWLSAALGLGMIGVASCAAGLWLALRLGIEWSLSSGKDLVREARTQHAQYGRWSVSTYALIWALENMYYLILPMWGGLEASAALKALTNLLMPLLRTYAALSPLVVATLARARRQFRFGQLVRFFVALFIGGAVVYWGCLTVFDRLLLQLLYGAQYGEYAQVLWLLGLVPLFNGVVVVFSGALRALERPDQVFWAHAFSTGMALTAGVSLIATQGLIGAVSGLWLSGVVGAIAVGVFYLQSEGPASLERTDVFL
jgi:O-antigen/teichoic acid export membrane protein